MAGHFEAGKLETWSDNARDQAPGAQTLSGLPDTHWDDGLWAFASGDIGTERYCFGLLTVIAQAEPESKAGVPEPDLRSIDGMPVRPLPLFEQKADRSHCGALAGLGRSAKSFCVPPALRMRNHPKSFDDALRVELLITLQALCHKNFRKAWIF